MLNKVFNFYLYFKILLDKKILLILIENKGLIFENLCYPESIFHVHHYKIKLLFLKKNKNKLNKTTNKFIKLRHNSMSLMRFTSYTFCSAHIYNFELLKYLKYNTNISQTIHT